MLVGRDNKGGDGDINFVVPDTSSDYIRTGDFNDNVTIDSRD